MQKFVYHQICSNVSLKLLKSQKNTKKCSQNNISSNFNIILFVCKNSLKLLKSQKNTKKCSQNNTSSNFNIILFVCKNFRLLNSCLPELFDEKIHNCYMHFERYLQIIVCNSQTSNHFDFSTILCLMHS